MERETTLRLSRLDTVEDWTACEERLAELEVRCPLEPWANRAFWGGNHILRGGRGEHWLVEWTEGQERVPWAATVLRKVPWTRGPVTFSVLRSVDNGSIAIPVLLTSPARRREALDLLADELPRLREVTGADLLVFSRLKADWSRLLADALHRRGTPHRRRHQLDSRLILLPEELGTYMDARRDICRDNARRRRKWRREGGGELAVEHLWLASPPDSPPRAWDDFLALHRNSWQVLGAARDHGISPTASETHLRGLTRRWIAIGARVLLSILRADGRAMAAYLSIVRDGEALLIVTCHDPSERRLGPGVILLENLVARLHELGCRTLVLGEGEAGDWKRRWANGDESLEQLSLALPSWRARIWSLATALRGAAA